MADTAASTYQDMQPTVSQELTLSETLRVLEVARGLRNERQEAAAALARAELRQMMRQWPHGSGADANDGSGCGSGAQCVCQACRAAASAPPTE